MLIQRVIRITGYPPANRLGGTRAGRMDSRRHALLNGRQSRHRRAASRAANQARHRNQIVPVLTKQSPRAGDIRARSGHFMPHACAPCGNQDAGHTSTVSVPLSFTTRH
jgi:hypothetical protein